MTFLAYIVKAAGGFAFGAAKIAQSNTPKHNVIRSKAGTALGIVIVVVS